MNIYILNGCIHSNIHSAFTLFTCESTVLSVYLGFPLYAHVCECVCVISIT